MTNKPVNLESIDGNTPDAVVEHYATEVRGMISRLQGGAQTKANELLQNIDLQTGTRADKVRGIGAVVKGIREGKFAESDRASVSAELGNINATKIERNDTYLAGKSINEARESLRERLTQTADTNTTTTTQTGTTPTVSSNEAGSGETWSAVMNKTWKRRQTVNGLATGVPALATGLIVGTKAGAAAGSTIMNIPVIGSALSSIGSGLTTFANTTGLSSAYGYLAGELATTTVGAAAPWIAPALAAGAAVPLGLWTIGKIKNTMERAMGKDVPDYKFGGMVMEGVRGIGGIIRSPVTVGSAVLGWATGKTLKGGLDAGTGAVNIAKRGISNVWGATKYIAGVPFKILGGGARLVKKGFAGTANFVGDTFANRKIGTALGAGGGLVLGGAFAAALGPVGLPLLIGLGAYMGGRIQKNRGRGGAGGNADVLTMEDEKDSAGAVKPPPKNAA